MSNELNTKLLSVIRVATGAALSALLAGTFGCSQSIAPQETEVQSQVTGNQAVLAPKMFLTVTDGGGKTVYSDNGQFSAFQLAQNTAYHISVTGQNIPAGATPSLTLLSNAIVSAQGKPVALTGTGPWNGNIAANLLAPADYSASLVINSPTTSRPLLSKSYSASVTCLNPPLGGSATDSSNWISVTGTNANYAFNAGGAVNDAKTLADPSATYTCAFDYTGIGAMDGPYGNCTQSSVANYVKIRAIRVKVKESVCNSARTYTSTLTLPAAPPFDWGVAVPATPPTPPIYIWGVVQNNSTGAVSQDVRVGGASGVPGVSYFGNNNGSSYVGIVEGSAKSNGTSMDHFSLESQFAYSQPGVISQNPFGMTLGVDFGQGISMAGVSESDAPKTLPSAKITQLTYTTDQISDQAPSISLSGKTCTTTGVYYKPQKVKSGGNNCTGSCTTVSTDNAPPATFDITLLVWGSYSCQVSGTQGTATIQGTFSGLPAYQGQNFYCDCPGGGGGGGSVSGPAGGF